MAFFLWARDWPGSTLFRLRRDKVGFVFQLYHPVAALRAWENVLVPTVPWGRENLRERLVHLLELLGRQGSLRASCPAGTAAGGHRASWIRPGTAA